MQASTAGIFKASESHQHVRVLLIKGGQTNVRLEMDLPDVARWLFGALSGDHKTGKTSWAG